MRSDTLQAIEENIRQARTFVEAGDAIERLRANRDFRSIVLEGYFEQEAIRLVQLKSAPGMQSADSQKSILAQMDAIGALHQYFNTVLQQSSMARKAIAADEQAREEILAEELSHG